MRHGNKNNNLSRSSAHRKALLTGLAKSLILHKRIQTTVAKAKALRKFVEPIITRARHDTMHDRRTVFSYFQDKSPVKELFNEIAPRIGDRPGGYTRIIRLGNRLGDNAETCMIELVDYNELFVSAGKSEKNVGRSSRKNASDSISATPGVQEQGASAVQGVQEQDISAVQGVQGQGALEPETTGPGTLESETLEPGVLEPETPKPGALELEIPKPDTQ